MFPYTNYTYSPLQGYFAICVLAGCRSDLFCNFLSADWKGCTPDVSSYKGSGLKDMLDKLPDGKYAIVDEAVSSTQHCLSPYKQTSLRIGGEKYTGNEMGWVRLVDNHQSSF